MNVQPVISRSAGRFVRRTRAGFPGCTGIHMFRLGPACVLKPQPECLTQVNEPDTQPNSQASCHGEADQRRDEQKPVSNDCGV